MNRCERCLWRQWLYSDYGSGLPVSCSECIEKIYYQYNNQLDNYTNYNLKNLLENGLYSPIFMKLPKMYQDKLLELFYEYVDKYKLV